MTDGLAIRPIRVADTAALLELRLRNRGFLTPFEPARDETFFSAPWQSRYAELDVESWERGTRYAFGVWLDALLIGRVSLDNVVRGAWQNATLGYFISEEHNGRGFATEAVTEAVRFAFGKAGLHRIQAGVMPRNVASIRVLEKIGFRFEGVALRYLQINGAWEDHNMYAVTAEEWPASTG